MVQGVLIVHRVYQNAPDASAHILNSNKNKSVINRQLLLEN